MDVETLKQALHDPAVSTEATRVARNVAISAREGTHSMLSKMDQQVQLNVAKAVGATVEIRSHLEVRQSVDVVVEHHDSAKPAQGS